MRADSSHSALGHPAGLIQWGVNERIDVILCSLELLCFGTQALGRSSTSPSHVCLMNVIEKGHSRESEHPKGVLMERVLRSTHHPRPL